MKEITLRVPQGIGDIFWVYQKFAPYFELINFEVPAQVLDPVQVRSNGWLQLLPKCGMVEYPRVSFHCARNFLPMQKILSDYDRGVRHFEYACNHALEQGVRLEAIDKKHLVEWDVPVAHEVNPLFPPPFQPKTFLTLYISQHTRHALSNGLWSLAQWLELVDLFYERWRKPAWIAGRPETPPFLLLGAEYDRSITELAAEQLTQRGYKAETWIGRSPAEAAWALKHSCFHLGFQSGLGILADNFATPQLMMYFNHLTKLMYSWCRADHAGRIFHAAQFNQTPAEVMETIRL